MNLPRLAKQADFRPRMQGPLRDEHNIHLRLFAVGSEGLASERVATSNGFVYEEAPNHPLGAKWNSGLRAMHERFPSLDAVLIVGSDDLIEQEYLVLCRDYLQTASRNYTMLGLLDMYYFDLKTLQLVYTAGYTEDAQKRRPDRTLGFGRCVKSSIMDAVDWSPWIDHENAELDKGMYESFVRVDPHLLSKDAEHLVEVRARDHGLMPLDVKSETNLWGFQHVTSDPRKPVQEVEIGQLALHYRREGVQAFLDLHDRIFG